MTTTPDLTAFGLAHIIVLLIRGLFVQKVASVPRTEKIPHKMLVLSGGWLRQGAAMEQRRGVEQKLAKSYWLVLGTYSVMGT